MSVLLDAALAGSQVATWVGVALIVVAVAALVLLLAPARRAGRSAPAGPREARGRVKAPQGYWHPSMGPRCRPVEPVTQLLPRCGDDRDATIVIPRQRAAVGGGRRG